jgi:mannose-6-phosphate isomerase-like protein (cupin superfamily)
MSEPVAAKNLMREVATVSDYWSPRVVGRVNNQYVKVAKLKGELAWHKHDDEDELFLILQGQLTIQFQDREVSLEEGDFYVIPKGTMHNPIAERECWIALVETVTTLHTGDVETPLTRSIDQQLGPGT